MEEAEKMIGRPPGVCVMGANRAMGSAMGMAGGNGKERAGGGWWRLVEEAEKMIRHPPGDGDRK